MRIIAIFLLLLGIVLRFTNIESKPYWGDEADSLSWISGTLGFKAKAFAGNQMSVADVLSYQRPYANTTLSDTYHSIYYEHAPLYYLLARVWMELFNSDLMTARSLAALISLLVFPSIYWLCLELFQSSLVGWLAMGIVAVSPFHLLYAQEARQYTLWIVLILLTSLTLLRAIRLKNISAWSINTIALTLLLYTHLLSIIVIFTHTIYLILQERLRLTKTLQAYLLSCLAAVILFIPWIIQILPNYYQLSGDQSPSWSKEPTSIPVLIKTWLFNLSGLFWDFNESFTTVNALFHIITLALVAYSVYFLSKHDAKSSFIFIVLMISVPFLIMAIPDIVLGGRRSTPTRYFIPSFLAIEISVSYLLSTQILQRKVFLPIIISSLIFFGIVSSVVVIKHDTWWSKQREYYNTAAAKLINQTEKPLVLANWYDLLTVAHSLKPQATLQEIRLKKDLNSFGTGFSDIFVYLNEGIVVRLQKEQPQFKIEQIYTWSRRTNPVSIVKAKMWKLKQALPR